ncbi:DnaD domain protein [Bacillus cereus group sp. RP29]|uniref:DnaD domain protein n=1 Tax=Bacillus cereus group sp. RP29 TaxID=3040257 RepID=UPI0033948E91
MEQDFENQVKQFIELMNSSNPEKLLSNCIAATTPHWRDLNSISIAKENGRLSDPVINVLIHYIMLTTEVCTLNRLFSGIAVDWSKKDVKTVEEALTLAKQENAKYKKWNEKYNKDSELGHVLREAIICGMTNKQLGQYVRLLLNKDL